MKFFLYIVILLFSSQVFAQDVALAKQYFDEGKFEKALVYYKKLYKNNSLRSDYLQYLISCYQQLEHYKEVEIILLQKLKKPQYNPIFYVELGYNYSLQKNKPLAKTYYEKAIKEIEENPEYAYSIGNAFRKKALLKYAIETYTKGIALDTETNFNLNYSIASLHGEMGNIEDMYNTYLQIITQNERVLEIIKRKLNDFIIENPQSENNILFKKTVLKKTQTQPHIVWNELLSWLFTKQKQYNMAFIQEKAIYKRSERNSLERIFNLGETSFNENDTETASSIFKYIIGNAYEPSLQLHAHLYIIEILLKHNTSKNIAAAEEKFNQLLQEFPIAPQTLSLQIAYAQFLAFQKNKPTKAIAILKQNLIFALNKFEEAKIKMTLAAILVYDEKFNQALLYYSQVQKSLKNDILAQKARFKVAQTSFYKGDFDWALTQLNVLKASTTQLIANDALQLSLLISDNSLEDSTQTALKIYAKADLLAFQNKNTAAITLLNSILTQHKGEKIEDEALYKQAKLFEKQQQYENAISNYLKIMEFHPNDILVDDTLFALAELYNHQLSNPEKAKETYEKIIFNHPDSIYFVTAREQYRKLRGDPVN